MLMLKTCRG